ncbi:uncharacterized protein LOC129574307 isoform X2 [Sitodiplosis mosellana]|uniref:uncharacterized protein LOC129574307 isoform X2 n=1 Tax=Sitodiplosis mosellana TaxID=263140 RepID=UPI00244378DF|nr:uncharacterized protein LOC129574307 isoform X2 [Sitodiplosis mosellana]
MARGIMADKGDKVVSPTTPEHNESKSQTAPDPSNHQPTAPCSCTKISTMQLFYEMKQKFPTVPDNVVCEFVGQNCHNRSAVIDGLEDYPNSANVYPQALRNQSTKKKAQPNSGAATAATTAKSNDATKENDTSAANGVPLKPPNTLYLTNLNYFTRPINRPVNRPTRQAPPPPIAAATSPHQQHQKSLCHQPQLPLNLSVNLIVSPVSQASSQSQQPLPHYSFTLHQPSGNRTGHTTTTNYSHPENELTTTTTGTINDNTDGPQLRFMSSAYDAEIGYQSRLEVTVAGPNQPSVAGSYEFLKETETVNHQVLCKQKLVLELEKDRKRLERMQRELQAIQAPIPDGGLDGLNLDIDKLRHDCKLMASLVEEAGPSYALGETNEAFYRNIYTGQQLPMQQRQPLRPHRPAPTPYQQHRPKNRSTAGTDPRFISTSTITQSPLDSHFGESNEDAGWTCDLCTFQNKYTQRSCEACTMPFLSAVMSANGEDIHIHLFPGQNSVIHSWVVS